MKTNMNFLRHKKYCVMVWFHFLHIFIASMPSAGKVINLHRFKY